MRTSSTNTVGSETNFIRRNTYIPENIFDIATIFFSFQNCKLLSLLENRGRCIREGNSDKIKDMNQEIEEYIKENKKEFQRPISAFVTFKSIKGS